MGVELSKKPKDLSASEREERGYGEGVSTEDVCTYDVVCSRKAARIFDGQPPSPSCRNASTPDHNGTMCPKVTSSLPPKSQDFTAKVTSVLGIIHKLSRRCKDKIDSL